MPTQYTRRADRGREVVQPGGLPQHRAPGADAVLEEEQPEGHGERRRVQRRGPHGANSTGLYKVQEEDASPDVCTTPSERPYVSKSLDSTSQKVQKILNS